MFNTLSFIQDNAKKKAGSKKPPAINQKKQ